MNVFKALKSAFKRLLTRKNGIFYINGPETLPPPLSADEEREVISKMASDF